MRPAFWIGRLFWKQGDVGIIDRFGPNGSAAVVAFGSRMAVRMQSGYLYSYALVMLLGLVAGVSWMMVRSIMNAGDIPVLSIMLAVPMLAAAACLFVRAGMARIIALAATLLNLVAWASGCGPATTPQGHNGSLSRRRSCSGR